MNKGANDVEPDREYIDEKWMRDGRMKKSQVREAGQTEKGEKYSKEIVHMLHQQGITWSAKF